MPEQSLSGTEGMEVTRACLENHSRHLPPLLCAIFGTSSGQRCYYSGGKSGPGGFSYIFAVTLSPALLPADIRINQAFYGSSNSRWEEWK